MSIRNDRLGGKDFISDESLYPNDLNETFESSNDSSLPVGIIISWAKTLIGTADTIPNKFLECNGTTVNDIDSPLNGVVIPDLNGNQQFLKGENYSGGTAGYATHVMTHVKKTDIDDFHTNTPYAGYDDHTEVTNKPPYYTVVYIIKYK